MCQHVRRQDTQTADLAHWTQIRTTAPLTEATAQRQLWAAARFTCGPQSPLPTLLLSSAGDHLVHPHCTARLATAWQAPHHQHPRACHDLPHDDAGWVVQRVVDATP